MPTPETTEAAEHGRDGERICVWWRCGESCWGLPQCAHPERTPFYDIKLPDWGALAAKAARREKMFRILTYSVWILAITIMGLVYL